MIKVSPEFVHNASTGYCDRWNFGHRCELEHECVCIPYVIANKSSEQFSDVIFNKRVHKMIPRMHPNPEEKHRNVFLSLSTITD